MLFIDEVHRLQPALEEILYSALEDYKLDIIIGQGPSARTHTMDVKPFTFIGATTRAGLLSSPLRSRFGIVLRLEFYSHEDLRIIVERSAEILGVEIDKPGRWKLPAARGARRESPIGCCGGCATMPRCGAQGTSTCPRRRLRCRCSKWIATALTKSIASCLLTIIEKYQGGPVGVNTLAAALAEEPDAIEEIYEPFLIQIGFLNRTPRGRVATQLAYEHFGITPNREQSSLF